MSMRIIVIMIAFTLAGLAGMAQTNQPLPSGAVPFGATTYLSPTDSTIWLYKERDGTAIKVANWVDVDSLFKEGYTKAQVDSAIRASHPITELPNFLYKAQRLLSESDTVLNVGIFGDSWTQGVPNAINYVIPLSRVLRARFGNGGGGFYDFSRSNPSSYMKSADPLDAYDTRSGTITYLDQESGVLGVNLAHAVFGNGSSLTLNVTTAHSRIVVHYYAGSIYGTFRYRVDGDSWTNIDASSGTQGHRTIPINVADTTHVIDFEVTSGNVILFGVDMQRSAGIRVHKLGNRGLQAYHFNLVSMPDWRSSLASLDLDAMTVLLGTNDRTFSRPPDDFRVDMEMIVDNIRQAIPYIDLSLISPSNNQNSAAYEMSQYRDELMRVASSDSVGFVDLIPLFGSREEILAKGTFADPAHPTVNGGNMVSDYLITKLFQNRSEYTNKVGGVYTWTPSEQKERVPGQIEIGYSDATDAGSYIRGIMRDSAETSFALRAYAVPSVGIQLLMNQGGIRANGGVNIFAPNTDAPTGPNEIGTVQVGNNGATYIRGRAMSGDSTSWIINSASGTQMSLYQGGISVNSAWTPTLSNHVVTKSYVDGGFVNTTSAQSAIAGNKGFTGHTRITPGTTTPIGVSANSFRITRNTSLGTYLSLDDPTGVQGFTVYSLASSGVQMRLINGGIEANGAYTNTSDSTIKNIISYDWSAAGSLPAKAFTYKNNRDSGRVHVGYIAQEVRDVLPDAVYVNEDSGLLSVDHVQVLIAKLALLEQKVKDLEAHIEALELQEGAVYRPYRKSNFPHIITHNNN